MSKKHYFTGEFSTRRVWLDGKELFPDRSQKVINHSPDGFAWGYGGSGAAQLALAICLEIYSNDESKAIGNYQGFKWDVIAKLPESDFEATFESITSPDLRVLTSQTNKLNENVTITIIRFCHYESEEGELNEYERHSNKAHRKSNQTSRKG